MSKAEASELETGKVKSVVTALSLFFSLSLSPFSICLLVCAEYPLLDRGRFKGLRAIQARSTLHRLRLHRLALRVLFIIAVISRDGVARFAGDSKERLLFHGAEVAQP